VSGDRDPLETAVLRKLRLWAGVVVLALVAFVVIADTLGSFLNADFRVNDIFLPTLVGALLALIGIAGLVKK